MKIYRVSHYTVGGESEGFSYYSSRIEAEKQQVIANREDREDDLGQIGDEHPGEVEEVEFALTKKGIIRLLNRWGGHADNG